MMFRRHSTCHVCNYSLTLRRLKTVLMDLQNELRVEWKLTPIVQLDEHIFPYEGGRHRGVDWFLLNDEGKPTVIPSYSVADRNWKKAFFLNPLDVDWMEFEIHSSIDFDYLVSVVEILHDMLDLWVNDEDTREQTITRSFQRFSSALKRLLMYAANNSFSR
jgi:hypothetical protein